jgi:hypothetical protein
MKKREKLRKSVLTLSRIWRVKFETNRDGNDRRRDRQKDVRADDDKLDEFYKVLDKREGAPFTVIVYGVSKYTCKPRTESSATIR